MYEKPYRVKPLKTRLNVSLQEQTIKEFYEYCREVNKYDRSRLVECILEDFLKMGKKV
jgi:metal-responsive CopG/Arc/MetJ family transcriptional regulator